MRPTVTRPAATELLLARAFAGEPGIPAAGDDADPHSEARLRRFLDEYWQRRALHIAGAIEGFELPLDADELAGLACEDDVDARIVRREGDRHVLEQGPFDAARFDTLGDRDWTLLVNAVDLAIPGFEPLLRAARFVPDWRLDDIMVSFAAPGGSVGAHFDRYDVFLLQGEGTRRWELGGDLRGAEAPARSDAGLLLVEDFSPTQVVHCHAGDGLYVPPGMVHHGIAETPCLTISLGFRAPSRAELVSDWALLLGERLQASATGALPADLEPALPADPALLDPRTLRRARAIVKEEVQRALDADDDSLGAWLGELLSRPGRAARFDASDPIGPEALGRELAAGAVLERAPGLRLLIRPLADGTLVFAGGETFRTTLAPDALAAFTRLSPLTAADLETPAALHLAAELCSAGRLELMDPDG